MFIERQRRRRAAAGGKAAGRGVALFLILLAPLFLGTSSGSKCLSSGFKFPVDSYPQDYSENGDEAFKYPICASFQHNTCCSPEYARGLLPRSRLEEEALQENKCREFTELKNCFPCDPDVGTGKTTKICKSFCDGWYDSCQEEFYESNELSGGKVLPCGSNSILCSKLRDIIPNGQVFCEKSGFKVASGDTDGEIEPCFDGSSPKTKGLKRAKSSEDRDPQNGPNSVTIKQLWAVFVANLLASLPSWTHKYIRKLDRAVKDLLQSLDKVEGAMLRLLAFILSLFLLLLAFLVGSQNSRRRQD